METPPCSFAGRRLHKEMKIREAPLPERRVYSLNMMRKGYHQEGRKGEFGN